MRGPGLEAGLLLALRPDAMAVLARVQPLYLLWSIRITPLVLA